MLGVQYYIRILIAMASEINKKFKNESAGYFLAFHLIVQYFTVSGTEIRKGSTIKSRILFPLRTHMRTHRKNPTHHEPFSQTPPKLAQRTAPIDTDK